MVSVSYSLLVIDAAFIAVFIGTVINFDKAPCRVCNIRWINKYIHINSPFFSEV